MAASFGTSYKKITMLPESIKLSLEFHYFL
jgi:hypothetical protein